jgi:predicted DNA-binding transcriptional regulator AlpA
MDIPHPDNGANPASAPLADRNVTTREAAEFLGLDRKTLSIWRMKNTGPPYCKFGRAVRYNMLELRRWRDARQVLPPLSDEDDA